MTVTIWSVPTPSFAVFKQPETLDEIKAHLKFRVDNDAELIRSIVLTGGPGQAMTYLEKHNQAQAVLEMGEAAANALSEQDRRQQFPTLAASVGIEAPTLFQCAQISTTRYETWADLSYEIERARLLGKKAIGDALDAASAYAVFEAIAWPSP